MTASTTAWRAKRRRAGARVSRGPTFTMTRMGKAAGAAAAIIMFAGLGGAAQAQDQPALREGVVAIVNDNIISSYDVAQRIRFIIATSGIQVTDQNKAQLEQEALNELIDERLELQEVRRAEKDQAKQGATQQIVATDAEVDERIGEISTENFHMSGQQFLDALSNAGI